MDKQKIHYVTSLFLLLFLSFNIYAQDTIKKDRIVQGFRFAMGSYFEGQHQSLGMSPGIEYHVLFPNRFIIGGSVFADISFKTTHHLADDYSLYQPSKTNQEYTEKTFSFGTQVHLGVCIVRQKKWRVNLIFPQGIYYQTHYSTRQWIELGEQKKDKGKKDKLAFIFLSGLKLDTEYKVNRNVLGLSLMVEPNFALINIFSNWFYPVYRAQLYYQIDW